MKYKTILFSIILIAAALILVSCQGAVGPAGPAGPEGPAGPAGPAGEAGASAVSNVLESCTTCHKGTGATHQKYYNEMYQDGVITVTDLAYTFTAPKTHTVTFTMKKAGAPIDATKVKSLAIYFAPYDGTAFQFEPALERVSLKGDVTCDAAGKCKSVLAGEDAIRSEERRVGKECRS